jgi:acetyl-CoA acetyltransferase
VHALSGRAAIAGIGATRFSKDSGVSELHLAVEACAAAIKDAGLSPKDVDGLVTFDIDTSPHTDVANNLGLGNVSFLGATRYGGGGGCATVQLAVMAVATGVCKAVVCYRAFNERSGQRFGSGLGPAPSPMPGAGEVSWGWTAPHGIMTPAATVAMVARRYMHEYGASSEDFGRISVLARAHAATNPNAWFYGRPITLAEHQASRMIADPVRLLDCCQESDGGVAILVTSFERAKDLKQKPVAIKAAAQGSAPEQQMMTTYYRDSITTQPEVKFVAQQLWSQSGLTPKEMDALVMYDHFTPYVMMQLEDYGFCKAGEGPGLVASGALGLQGKWPLNPHGGQLGEAYIHGFNGIAEGVRQLRGTAVNQIKGAKHILVTSGNGIPSSALVLGLAN